MNTTDYRVIAKLVIALLLCLTGSAGGQTQPPYPWVDTGTEIKLRNPGARQVNMNTSFTVSQTGVPSVTSTEGLQLKPYATLSGATTEIRWFDISGANYFSIRAPDVIPISTRYTWPAAAPMAVQCLASDATGELSWTGCSGGVGTPGGSNTAVQFNDNGIFGGSSGFVFDKSTSRLTVTNATINQLTLGTPLSVAQGGTGSASATPNGILYGNGTAPLGSTAVGGINTVLMGTAGAPAFSTQPTVSGLSTVGQTGIESRPYGVAGGQTGEHRFLELAAGGTNYVGFKAPDSIAANTIWRLPAGDSSGTQCLASDGNANLSWSACSGGTGTPGGSNTQVQYNAVGSFAGSPSFVFNAGTATLTVSNLLLTNPLGAAQGGSGLTSLTTNGILYGNGASPVGVTPAGVVNSVLTSSGGAPAFSQQPVVNSVITKSQSALRLDPYSVGAGQTGELRFMQLAAGGTNYVGFKAPDTVATPLIWTLPPGDSTGPQCLSSNGSAILGWSNCATSVGGLNGQIQVNASGVFAGYNGLTWNTGTNTLTATNLALTNPLPLAQGGTGTTSLTTNGVLYGSSPLGATAQGGANTILAANNGAPFFTGNPSLSTGIKTFGQTALEVFPYGTSLGNTGETRYYELAANGTNYVGFKAPNVMASNVVLTMPATDSSGTQCLSSNGSGVLAWSNCSGGTGTPGGSNTFLQYNSAGSFAGSNKMTFDGTTTVIDTLTVSNTFVSDGSTFKVNSSTHSVDLGAAGRTGLLKLFGTTSGSVSLTSNAVAGSWTMTLPATAGNPSQTLTTDGTGTLAWSDAATATNTLTLTNKRVTPRVQPLADGTSITPTGDTADKNIHTNTQVAGTFTVNAPSGTPTDGQCLWLRMKSVNVQTFAFNGIYRASGDLPLPTTSTGSGKTDYLLVCYNLADTKWDYMARNFGF